MRTRWTPILALAAIGAVAVGLLLVPGDPAEPVGGGEARAQDLTLPQQAADYLAGLRTIYLQNGWYVARADLEAPALAVDFRRPGLGRFHWDGTTARYATPSRVGIPREVIDLPPDRAEWLHDVWQELRAGFPNTTFHPGETPAAYDPRFELQRGDNWYRVELPFAWASEVAVYMNVGGRGRPGSVQVFDKASGERFEWRNMTSGVSLGFAATDVPLGPDVYSPELPMVFPPDIGGGRPGNPQKGDRRPYHEAQTELVLEYDEAVSNGRSHQSDPMKGLYWYGQACPEAPKVHKLEGTLVWRFPDDPAEAQRAQAAVDVCPEVTFRFLVRGEHAPDAGQRTCIDGDVLVLDTSTEPPTVRMSHHIAECQQGRSREEMPYLVDWTLQPGADPSTTEVRFDGSVQIHCLEVGTETGAVRLAVKYEDEPRFSWSGCYPGWSD